MSGTTYDAFLLLSFGGPEGMDDVQPFLENVLRGRNVPAERMKEVAHHYELVGGVSPLNAQNRALLAAVKDEFAAHGTGLPVFWGNRNWRPYLADTMKEIADAGHRRVVAFATSAFSCYSGCRQYREDLARAREAVGPSAPEVDKVRVFYNHPGFIAANIARVEEVLGQLAPSERESVRLVFTAHSLPVSMATAAPYEAQLRETARLVAEGVGVPDWDLVYQSRSGPPSQPWLEPDVCDHLRAVREAGVEVVALSPIGFTSDHMEVVYDLDTEARECCEEIGLRMVRAGTAGTHPAFVAMIRELVEERMQENPMRRSLGGEGAWPDICPEGCCVSAARRGPVRG